MGKLKVEVTCECGKVCELLPDWGAADMDFMCGPCGKIYSFPRHVQVYEKAEYDEDKKDELRDDVEEIKEGVSNEAQSV